MGENRAAPRCAAFQWPSHKLSHPEDKRSCKHPSEHRCKEEELHPPRADILRNSDNLGMVLQLGKHLLAQTGELGVNLGVLDILVAEVICHVLDPLACF